MKLATMKKIKEYITKNDLSISLIDKSVLGDTGWEQMYKDNAAIIDNICYRLYEQNVLEDTADPTITNNTVALTSELSFNSNLFIKSCKMSLDKMWELESVNFSPIENYDRYEDISTVRSGNETTELEKSGTEKETSTTNGAVENAIKNNQTETVKNEPTSYTTNLIDTSTTEYSGNADTSTTTYNDLTDIKETAYTNRKDTTKHNYNNITDKHESHIHGNIGVTTATAMMTEYVGFYSTYKFWEEFWKMYGTVNFRTDYNTETED